MILAGDIGGTKTLVGLFDPIPARPQPIVVREFATLEFESLSVLLKTFLRDAQPAGTIDAGCFGVAGPVVGNAAELTNVPWRVDGHMVARDFNIPHVVLLNDLQAMAHSVTVLNAEELHVLQQGTALRGGNIALIAAGTGLGESLLHNVNGRFIPSPSEAGHADFPARNEREMVLVRDLIAHFGRARVEDVLSGPGLVNLHRVTHTSACAAGIDREDPDAPARISTAALERRCPACGDALTLFVEAYGAEAGNMALRTVSTGGLFIGGGIARKILPALTDGRFLDAFRSKKPFEEMMRSIPVHVILNTDAGLLGAAVFAASL